MATKILPNIGAPVSSPAFDPTKIAAMSISEVVYAEVLFLLEAIKRLADPAVANKFARFVTAAGADWSGYHPNSATGTSQHEEPPGEEHATGQQVPMAPDNYYDSLPGIGFMARQIVAGSDALLTHLAAHVQAVMQDQETGLGVPKNPQTTLTPHSTCKTS